MIIKKIFVFLIFFFFTCILFYSDENNKHIDLEKVKTTWLSWVNEEREKNNLHPYKYHDKLNETANLWCLINFHRGDISHKRNIYDTAFYNYEEIEQWFLRLKIKFKNIKGYTFSENTGWGYFYYSSGDYTDYVIKAIRSTFDYYMSEKGKSGYWESAHYRSIMAPFLYYIGFGLVIDEENKKYYLTIHYGSEIIEVKDNDD